MQAVKSTSLNAVYSKGTMRRRYEVWFVRMGLSLTAAFDGGGGSAYRLPYVRSNCSGTFEVANNSLARATRKITQPGRPPVQLQTDTGAVVEMVGD